MAQSRKDQYSWILLMWFTPWTRYSFRKCEQGRKFAKVAIGCRVELSFLVVLAEHRTTSLYYLLVQNISVEYPSSEESSGAHEMFQRGWCKPTICPVHRGATDEEMLEWVSRVTTFTQIE